MVGDSCYCMNRIDLENFQAKDLTKLTLITRPPRYGVQLSHFLNLGLKWSCGGGDIERGMGGLELCQKGIVRICGKS